MADAAVTQTAESEAAAAAGMVGMMESVIAVVATANIGIETVAVKVIKVIAGTSRPGLRLADQSKTLTQPITSLVEKTLTGLRDLTMIANRNVL